MIGNEYIYAFKNNFGQFYGIDANNQLTISSTPYILKYNPDGWKDISIQNKRNRKYFGLDRSVTIPLSFVEDGATILKNIFYKYGPNAKVFLAICEQRLFISDTEYGFWYKVTLEAEADLSTWLHNGPKVNVTILEQGITGYIKANENTVYELPLDVPEKVQVKNDGIAIIQQAKWYLSNGALPNDLGGHSLSLDLISAEAVNAISASSQERVKDGNTPQKLWDMNQVSILTGSQPETFTFTWDFYMTPVLESVGAIFATSIILQLCVLTDRDTANTYSLDIKGGGDPLLLYNVKQHFHGTYSITIPANRKVLFYMTANQNREFTYYTYDADGAMQADYKYRYQQTVTNCLTTAYVFQQLIEKITDGNFKADVTGLCVEDSDKVWTSGDGIRGLDDSVIKISLAKFFGFFDTFRDAGIILTPEKKVKLDKKINLIDESAITDLGEVFGLKVSVANEFLFNNLKIGYPDKQIEDLNERESFCNTFEFAAGTLKAPKELNKVCEIITDCYTAEITRLRFGQKDTTSSRQDNDIYVFHIEDAAQIDGTYLFDRSLNASALGLIEKDSVYNIGLQVKRCILNNGSYFRACFDLLDNWYLKFQTSTKNNKLQAGLPLVIDKEDVLIASLNQKYFRPYWFEFETTGDGDLLDHLDENPLRVFRFYYLGVAYKGLPETVGIEPSSRKKQNYKLLCSRDTDTKPLIENYG